MPVAPTAQATSASEAAAHAHGGDNVVSPSLLHTLRQTIVAARPTRQAITVSMKSSLTGRSLVAKSQPLHLLNGRSWVMVGLDENRLDCAAVGACGHAPALPTNARVSPVAIRDHTDKE